ncbi:MAG: TonB-dependent receptor [Gemmatimonadaceae bacterium]
MKSATVRVLVTIFLAVSSLEARTMHAQNTPAARAQGRIAGVVRGAEGNAPFNGALVIVVGQPARTTTREDGSYAISIAPGTYQVRATRLGYQPVTQTVVVTANGTATADFVLTRQTTALDEVIVVGYGTQKRRDVTGAVSSVNVDEIATVQTSASVGELIQGRVAGAQVVQNNGAPGGGISIRIRGTNSITANSEPLYVIDGLPAYTGSGSQNAYDNPLTSISPEDIQSIEILKDASATAIYGTRGSNGVVLITTRLGRRGESKVSVHSTFGTQSPYRYIPMLNGRQFAEMANEAATNAKRALPYTAAQVQSFGAGTDWQRAVLRKAAIQSHTISVAGGDAGSRYFISGSVFDEEGIVRGTAFRRYAGRLNLDRTVTSRLRVGTNLTLSNVETDLQITDNALNSGTVMSSLWYNPNTPIRDPVTGEYIQNSAITFPVQNPVALVEQLQNDESAFTVLGSVFGEYSLFKGTTIRSSLGTTSLFDRTRYYAPRTTALGLNTSGTAREESGTSYNLINENILNSTRKVRSSDELAITAGFTYQHNTGESLYGANQGFVNDLTGVYNISSGTAPTSDTDYSEATLLSYLGRVNYSLAGRYIATISGRYDGSSRFGANQKWAFFPSAGLAWRIVDEPFLAHQTLFNDIKLRLGYGITGNEKIGPYNSLARLASRTYAFGGATVTGYYPAGAAPNPDLQWETTRQVNAGLDLSFLHERVTTSLDAYSSTTHDLLLSVPLPTTSGYTSQLRNIGSVRNRGVEFALNTVNVRNTNLSWTSTFTISTNRNEVTNIGEATEIIGPDKGISTQTGQTTVVIRKGMPLGSFLGYRTDGLYQMEDECPLTKKRANLDCIPGEYRYVDVNGDGQISAADRVILGNGQPDYFGGLQNNITVGAFSLNVFLNGSKGGRVLNAPAINLRNINILSNQTADALNRWTPENTNTNIPRANAARPREIYDVHVEDASFLRLQTLSLGYKLPDRLFPGTSSAQLTVTGENLKVWTKYKGYDPEVNSFGGNSVSRGIDLGAYPRAKRVSAGINLSF